MRNLGFHCHALNHLESGIIQNGLQRGEFYNFPEQDLPELKKKIERHDLAFSVHAPMVKTPWYPDPPTWSFLCDVDKEKRNLSLRMVRETVEIASDFGTEYVIVHFPTPPADAEESCYVKLKEIVWDTALHLAELSQKHNLPIHIEGFGPSPFLNEDFLIEVITTFPGLRYCFDTGHMHVASKRDGFDLWQFAGEMAPYIGSVHVWNSRDINDYLTYHHIAVHPSQRPEEGWADISGLLQLILIKNPSCPVIFESGPHYPEEMGKHDFRDGVKWVKEIVSTFS